MKMLTVLLLLIAAAGAEARVLIESRESLYNNIFIYREGRYVTMTFGHNDRIYTESQMNLGERSELPVAYTRHMTTAVAYPPRVESIAMVGLGGGRTSQYLHQFMPATHVRVSELDPEVIALARKHFQLRENDRYRVFAVDGRLFLRRQKIQFDVILVDAYRGPFVPFHLLTQEFYRLAKSRLAPGGVVAQNVEPSTMLFDGAVATMRSVFDTVDMYPGRGNVVLVAYDGPPRDAAVLRKRADQRQRKFGFRYNLTRLVNGRRKLTSGIKGEVLTDDFAPANMLKAIEERNRKWE